MSPKKPEQTPLYVKLPTHAVDKLHRAAEVLGVAKKDLVAGLVNHYVDPDSPQSLSALTTMSTRRPPGAGAGDNGPMLGSYHFHAYDPPEVMNAEQAAQFLQITEDTVIELAEAGKLPGRKLGTAWRFSRGALVSWLAAEVK